jgi:hypothetical protein
VKVPQDFPCKSPKLRYLKPMTKSWTVLFIRQQLQNKRKFNAKFSIQDMGHGHYASLASLTDLMWFLNHSRDHDGLRHLTLNEIENMIFNPKMSNTILLEFID